MYIGYSIESKVKKMYIMSKNMFMLTLDNFTTTHIRCIIIHVLGNNNILSVFFHVHLKQVCYNTTVIYMYMYKAKVN